MRSRWLSTRDISARFNFAPGPAQLPPEVIGEAAEAVRSFPPHSRSILELGHRSETFAEIIASATDDLRALLEIDEDYVVLFLNGGARLQYSVWLQNLTTAKSKLGYVDSGGWSELAISEAHRLHRSVQVFKSEDASDYPDIARPATASLDYLHYVSNETLTGVQMPPPDTECRLVCDSTSDFLSRPLDLRPFALCYAGTQKNIGTAGLTVVLVRRDCLREDVNLTPGFSYYAQAQANSLQHTPSVYAWYVCARMLHWIRIQGGLPEMARRAQTRAQGLYAVIDQSEVYCNTVARRARSHMNVCFTLPSTELETRFLREAEGAGLMGLRGHVAVGGVRASLYNAMPQAGVDALLEFMHGFEHKCQ